jgi:hypothetical protein
MYQYVPVVTWKIANAIRIIFPDSIDGDVFKTDDQDLLSRFQFAPDEALGLLKTCKNCLNPYWSS